MRHVDCIGIGQKYTEYLYRVKKEKRLLRRNRRREHEKVTQDPKIMRNSWVVFCYPKVGENCEHLNMKMGGSSITTIKQSV
jgi:hypothetical protein